MIQDPEPIMGLAEEMCNPLHTREKQKRQSGKKIFKAELFLLYLFCFVFLLLLVQNDTTYNEETNTSIVVYFAKNTDIMPTVVSHGNSSNSLEPDPER